MRLSFLERDYIIDVARFSDVAAIELSDQKVLIPI